jgi:hypothetical protein
MQLVIMMNLLWVNRMMRDSFILEQSPLQPCSVVRIILWNGPKGFAVEEGFVRLIGQKVGLRPMNSFWRSQMVLVERYPQSNESQGLKYEAWLSIVTDLPDTTKENCHRIDDFSWLRIIDQSFLHILFEGAFKSHQSCLYTVEIHWKICHL